jgi:hypothetical protein
LAKSTDLSLLPNNIFKIRERDLSCSDVNSIPKLAEVFKISVDELMQTSEKKKPIRLSALNKWGQMVLRAVAVGIGVAVVVLASMNELNMNSGFRMLGVGLTCLAITQFTKDDSV